MTATLIIDADPIIYAAGFAAQTTTYEYVVQGETGGPLQLAFSDGNAALREIRANKYEVLDKTVHTEAKDVGFARQAAKTQLSSIVKAAKQELQVEDLNVEIYLSGPGNFRYQIATIAPYKGDRPPPPIHYQALRDYLTHRWNAVVVSGVEADDKVSIRCRQLRADGTPFVLATIDKDLDQVPGLHYGYKNHVFYTIDEEEAELVFWSQCISGDTTDNIPGCYKIGATKAAELIGKWSKEFDRMQKPPELTWQKWIWVCVVDTFAVNIVQYPERYPKGITPEAAALETARLVFMQEYEGQLWNPPGVPHDDLSSLAPV